MNYVNRAYSLASHECVGERLVMLVYLENLQPACPMTESAASTESRELTEDRQPMADFYAKEILDIIIEDPCVSIPGIMGKLTRCGPCDSEESKIHLFWGPGQLKTTCRRMCALT